MSGDYKDAMFARIVGKVCDIIKQRTKIFTVITVLQMIILFQITTERQREGSSRTVYTD